LARRHSAREAPRESAVVEHWMDGWHGEDGEGGEPQPLLPPRRDDTRALATGAAWDEREAQTEVPRRRRTLHRVGGRDSLVDR
jgi:hypothetical protein